MGTFSGKTMFISGASRGIGLAIAKRVAADGANIALVAKTTEPHPKLPGTIYTAAKEIEDAGGHALPIVGDVRDGDSVAAARQQFEQAGLQLVARVAVLFDAPPQKIQLFAQRRHVERELLRGRLVGRRVVDDARPAAVA